MRLKPSPSILSSSFTTTSTAFDLDMCTSNSATASCLAGIWRRILCSRRLPTHPSDQVTETSSLVCDNNINKQQEFTDPDTQTEATAATNPGIVARLMGLESLPDTINSVYMQGSANSISRSRSMNSVEFRGEGGDQMQGHHRRIKSTLSFREMPTFLELENEEFFVLRFDNLCSSKECISKGRKCEVGSRKLREKRGEKCKRSKKNRREEAIQEKKNEEAIKENKLAQEIGISGKIEDSQSKFSTLPLKNSGENTNVSGTQEAKVSKLINHKEVSDDTKLRRNKKKKKKKRISQFPVDIEGVEGSSEDSSPVSVLDLHQFIIYGHIPGSEEDTESGESDSRRKLSRDYGHYIHLSQYRGLELIGDDQNSKKTDRETSQGSRKKVCHKQDNTKLWDEISGLAETEMGESNWIHHHKMLKLKEDFDDITAAFEFKIFEQLLQELVDQFS